MSYLRRFLIFWRNFLIGDDWVGAIIALVGCGLTYVMVRAGAMGFWVLPVFVVLSVAMSLSRRVWTARRAAGGPQAAARGGGRPGGTTHPVPDPQWIPGLDAGIRPEANAHASLPAGNTTGHDEPGEHRRAAP